MYRDAQQAPTITVAFQSIDHVVLVCGICNNLCTIQYIRLRLNGVIIYYFVNISMELQ